jgi:hypothetical protein
VTDITYACDYAPLPHSLPEFQWLHNAATETLEPSTTSSHWAGQDAASTLGHFTDHAVAESPSEAHNGRQGYPCQNG